MCEAKTPIRDMVGFVEEEPRKAQPLLFPAAEHVGPWHSGVERVLADQMPQSNQFEDVSDVSIG